MPRLPNLLLALIGVVTTLLRAGDLALENLCLRQQLAMYRHWRRRPRIRPVDCAFWVLLRRFWTRWDEVLHVVRPETVVRWHKQGFKRYWRWKSRRRGPGHPRIDADVIELIRDMSRANPRWGAPRIHGELRKLGIDVCQSTVARYMVKPEHRPRGGSWSAFIANHLPDLVAADFIVVPTASFRVLYTWVLLSADRREVLYFAVTENPTATWLAEQLRKAFIDRGVPGALLRDRDGAYGKAFRQALADLGVKDLMTQPRSPWQNGRVERLMGSIRRARRRRGRKPERQRGNVRLLDHVIVLDKKHLERLLTAYFRYYNETRTHLALDKDAPEGREVMGPELGEVVVFPEVGGLHHRYERRRRPKAA